MVTLQPGRRKLGILTASQLVILIQPELVERPMVSGLLVPCIPTDLADKPFQMMPTGLLGPGGTFTASSSLERPVPFSTLGS